MNFLLRHAPLTTYDVDLWIEDTPENRRRSEQALSELAAEWGADDSSWEPVSAKPPGWLDRQGIYSLTSPFGAIDIFRSVRGLEDWTDCRGRALLESTGAGTRYSGLSDADMLRCQLALDEMQRNRERVARLQRILGGDDDVRT